MATIPTVTADGVRGHEFLLWTCLNTSPDGAKITMMDNTIINCFICFSLEEAHVILGLVPNSKHKIKLFFCVLWLLTGFYLLWTMLWYYINNVYKLGENLEINDIRFSEV